jgi:hypothetical protein
VDTLIATPWRDTKRWPQRANGGEIRITNCPVTSKKLKPPPAPATNEGVRFTPPLDEQQ